MEIRNLFHRLIDLTPDPTILGNALTHSQNGVNPMFRVGNVWGRYSEQHKCLVDNNNNQEILLKDVNEITAVRWGSEGETAKGPSENLNTVGAETGRTKR